MRPNRIDSPVFQRGCAELGSFVAEIGLRADAKTIIIDHVINSFRHRNGIAHWTFSSVTPHDAGLSNERDSACPSHRKVVAAEIFSPAPPHRRYRPRC
jgi:hypothetical protein